MKARQLLEYLQNNPEVLDYDVEMQHLVHFQDHSVPHFSSKPTILITRLNTLVITSEATVNTSSN